jgi:hypothetical protein
MAANKTYAGLYYADFSVMSEGIGTIYAIKANTQLVVSNYSALGYILYNTNEHLAFSTAEHLKLRVTPSILPLGVSDMPTNLMQITGQNIKINYDWSSTAQSLQDLVLSNSERVINDNTLVKHLIPHFVSFDVTYTGDVADDAVVSALKSYVTKTQPDDMIEAYTIQDSVLKLGASNVVAPFTLVAIIHGNDRTIYAEQSATSLGVSRLAGFFVGNISAYKS